MEEDYIYCPSCGSNVAVVDELTAWRTQFAHCKYDCGFKWHMLIEPDPDTFHTKNPYKHILNKDGKSPEFNIIGTTAEIVPFEEDLDDIMYEDGDRYNRILKYSDYNNTNIDKSLSVDKDVPNNLRKKREKFFERYYRELEDTRNIQHSDTIINFLEKDNISQVDIDNVVYVLSMVCEMTIHRDEQSILKNKELNEKGIDEGYEDLAVDLILDSDIRAIAYNSYNQSKLAILIYKSDITLEELISTLKTKLSDYGIYLLYVKPENDKDNGCRPISGIYEEVCNDFKSGKIVHPDLQNRDDKYLADLVEKKKTEDSNSAKLIVEDKKFDIFLHTKTNINNLTIQELFELIKYDTPISGIQMKPFIITLEDFYLDLNTYINMPSLIDFDNKIVFMSISHTSIIASILELDKNLPMFKDKEEQETYFHTKYNMMQVFTSMVNYDYPKVLTFNSNNNDTASFISVLDKANIKNETHLYSNTINHIIVLNGTGVIQGKVYFPKPDEENIEKGKILVIPTASEEYFLPAISNMNGVGCIITEKGSKTAHLIINSKEFNFNMVLVDNALDKFQLGETLRIDLDNKTILSVS